jgi:hypothetical protein
MLEDGEINEAEYYCFEKSDALELMCLDVNGSFIRPEEERAEFLGWFTKRFMTLRPGDIILPGEFQDWLHPSFKRDYSIMLNDGSLELIKI